MPRLRPRISLLTALMLVTIVGLAIVVGLFWRKIGPLRREVRQLRNETGQLMVEDEDDVYVVARRRNLDAESGEWWWRVYLPPGKSYRLHPVVGPVLDNPRLPLPRAKHGHLMLEPGEYVARIKLQKPAETSWNIGYSVEPSGVSEFDLRRRVGTIALPWPMQWPGYRAGYGWSGVLGDIQRQFRADEPISLLRLFPDFTPDDQTGRNPADNKRFRESTKPPTAAFYLWIEPVNSEESN